ncbi:radical SAM family heme chaperone HemW [Fictibacillus gelatini]|uniref:radical SAM family heme chaperone HemW n=1 Tax=Fictibacillus gelatini TaxID=225985 RepID=UPI000410EBF9|nr:radical SAM family heme chaperone HemW [Fictibacillus gelatini]
MPEAVYLHIPFCVNICHYCDFNKVFLQGQPVARYLEIMEMEMKNTVKKYPYDFIETIFVGGGTPTALDEKQLEYFLQSVKNHFITSKLAEFTVEANPEQTTKKKLEIMKKYGVNRLSIGVQAFQTSLLKELGRTHRQEDVFATIKNAKETGIENISLDIMFGLPNQTVDMLNETLDIAFSLQIPHFSAYSLQIEKKTVFYNRFRNGNLPLPTEEQEAEMYKLLIHKMQQNGYHQYEISNFARPGYESKHNLQYWNNNEYYGIGAGAHSYVEGERKVNAGPLKKYMALIEETGFPYIESHKVSFQEKMEEELFMGLRKIAGVSDSTFKRRYGKSMFEIFKQPIHSLMQRGLLKKEGDTIALTKKGVFLGNEVFQEFITLES